MNYRIAIKQDAELIARLHALSWQNTYRGMLSDDYLENDVYPERLAVWQKRLDNANQNQFVMIAEHQKEALGFICVFGDEDERWGTLLDNLHTHPNAKGQGVGKSLMQQAARSIADSYDSKRMYLLVFEANQAACKFYEHMGGVKCEVIELTMPDGELVPSVRYVWENVESLLTREEIKL